MCRIAGWRCFGNVRPTFKELSHMLLRMEPQGRDATGFGTTNLDGSFKVVKAPVGANEFVKTDEWRDANPHLHVWGMLHTRQATQGDKSKAVNNHPVVCVKHTVKSMAIHNGIVVDKYVALPKAPEVDSFAFPYAASKVFSLDPHAAWGDAVDEITANIGGSAAIALVVEGRDQILLAADSAPLVYMVDEGKDILWFASTDTILQGVMPSYRGFYAKPAVTGSLSHDYMVVGPSGFEGAGDFTLKGPYQYNSAYYTDEWWKGMPDRKATEVPRPPLETLPISKKIPPKNVNKVAGGGVK